MEKTILRLSVIMLLSLLPFDGFGQGCSDAGFCTIDGFKPDRNDSVAELSSQFKVGFFYGEADNSINVGGSYIEYKKMLKDGVSFDLKATSIAQSGNGISEFGLSDLYVTVNYGITRKTTLTAGMKIPLRNGNQKKDDLPLPMDYQSSLGTVDLILGIQYQLDRVQLVAAYQQPIKQNSNEFIAEDYPVGSKLRAIQSTNNFKRSGDAMLRASLPIKLGNKLKFTPSILPIYHLKNDKYTDVSGAEREINGSQGLTLNGNIYLDYSVNNRNAVQFSLGTPFETRDKRPDGLTREFIANLEYIVKF